jgi:hypothetical protein
MNYGPFFRCLIRKSKYFHVQCRPFLGCVVPSNFCDKVREMVDKDAYGFFFFFFFFGFLVFEQIFMLCQFLLGANSEFTTPIYMVHFFFFFIY